MKKSDKSIIVMLIGILLAAASYFFVYKNLTAETEILNAENAKLRQEVQYLQELADNKQQYLDDTASMNVKIEEIKAQFPAQYLPEDEIYYMIMSEKEHDILATSIAMANPELIAVDAVVAETVAPTTEGDAAQVDTAAPAQPQIQLYNTAVTAVVETSYNSIKDLIKQINTDENRKSLNTLSLAFDSGTGGLIGTMSFSMYSLTGTEAEYKAPTVDGIVYGTSDIFNSAKKKAAAAAAASAAAGN
ncbi:MAG: hypothetical protein IJ029_01760 [Lachnospiraceae bacterium]|nr:hypothetical protein [Lachnospiraceae bacterium]MBQ8877429.1 hypothetical protein [Lachnospiraceae bacterium]